MSTKKTECIYINLKIDAQEYLKYYSGVARNVNARAIDGRRIQFPARMLRPFIRPSGIQGVFEIEVDENHKLVDIRHVSN